MAALDHTQQFLDDPTRTNGGPPQSPPERPSIAGLCALKGILTYAAVLAFAALYVSFIVDIVRAEPGEPPALNTAMLSAAAALAGVLGSAFALYVGVPTKPDSTNAGLLIAVRKAEQDGLPDKLRTWVRRAFSLEASQTTAASWPLTFGIWVYALVASAVAVTFVLFQQETPEQIRTLAIVFAGYILAMIYAAYGLSPKGR